MPTLALADTLRRSRVTDRGVTALFDGGRAYAAVMDVQGEPEPRRTAYRHLVSLGSSFAAGPGIPPLTDRAAGRSARNYPSLLAQALGARLTDLTVSGATTATILDCPQRTLRARFPPQIEGLPADADLVTVTAGGNDLGYIGSMMRGALGGWLRALPVLGPLAGLRAARADPAVTTAQREAATAGLVRVVEAVRERAPAARVVLVDYLTVLGDTAVPGRDVPLTAVQIEGFRAVAEQLARAFVLAAERTSSDLVQVSALSREHGLGSPEPWVTGFRVPMRPMPFHPTATGMQAVTGATLALLTSAASAP